MATRAETPRGERKPIRRVTKKPLDAEATITLPVEDTGVVLDAPTVVVLEPVEAAPRRRGFLGRAGGVRRRDVTAFLRQLIMLLEAGTPILRSLKTLANRGERRSIRNLVADIAAYVEAGNPLWQSFDRHPSYFDAIFVNLIRASEASGTLVIVLRRTVAYRERRELLHKRVRGAMIYPIMLLVACVLVMLLLTKVVIPQFQEMFEKAGIQVPVVTTWVMEGSNFFANWFWVPLILLAVLYAVYKLWYVRNPVRRMRSDRLLLKVPILGPIWHKNAMVEMTRTLALLLRSGLSMMASLELTRRAIHNRAVGHALQNVRDSVEQGAGLEPALRASKVIPPVVTDMLVTGEESGRVDLVCEQIADIYQEEVEISVSTLGETLQPLFTVVVGVAVIGLAVALFYPLVSMIEQITSATGG